MFKALLMTSVLFLAQLASANTCTVEITRTACSEEKKAEMLKPYDGKNPTVEEHTVKDEAECTKKGKELSKIVRTGTLAKKSTVAKFGGKEVGSASDDKTNKCK